MLGKLLRRALPALLLLVAALAFCALPARAADTVLTLVRGADGARFVYQLAVGDGIALSDCRLAVARYSQDGQFRELAVVDAPAANGAVTFSACADTDTVRAFLLADGAGWTPVCGPAAAAEAGAAENVTIVCGSTVTITDGSITASGAAGADLETPHVRYDGEEQTYTLLSAGTYAVSGTITDGQIIVTLPSSDDKAEIGLNGLTASCSDNAPFAATCGKIELSAKRGTNNSFTDGKTYASGSPASACVWSKNDLTLKGKGALTVTANCNNGVGTKKDLEIQNLTLTVTAANNALNGKKSVSMASGTLTLTAGGDGIQSDSEDEGEGSVTITGGSATVTAGDEAIQAAGAVTIAKDAEANTAPTLQLTANGGDGIKSENASLLTGSVAVSGGSVTITAADDGIQAYGSVSVSGGTPGDTTLNITSAGDGIHASEITTAADAAAGTAEAGTGTVTVSGGSVTIKAGKDGIQAYTLLSVTGGTLDLTTGGGATGTAASGESYKALKADSAATGSAGEGLVISGGTFTINALDDALHSNGDLTVTGGTFTDIRTKDDALHADAVLTVGTKDAAAGPEISVSACYEGLEGYEVYLNAGSCSIVSSDDGVNGAGGSDTSSSETFPQPGPGGGGSMNANGYIEINGGVWYVNAGGDGIDSNGSLVVNGGTIYVSGMAGGGNAALDKGDKSGDRLVLNGGLLAAAGYSDMAENPNTIGTGVCVLKLTYGSSGGHGSSGAALAAGTVLSIQKQDGSPILTFAPPKAYNSVIVCSPALTAGTYTISRGGAVTDAVTAHGFTVGGTAAGGTPTTASVGTGLNAVTIA